MNKRTFFNIFFLLCFCCGINAQKLDNYVAGAIGVAYIGSYLMNAVKHKTIKPHTNYTPNEQWPAKGYDIGSCGYYSDIKECTLQEFTDQDSVLYLKVIKNGMPEGSFYYMFINEEQADVILNNTLNKKLVPKRIDRIAWYKNLMESTGIKEVNNTKGNKYWTYFKPKSVFLKNDPDAIPDEHVRGMGKQRFSYKVAYNNYLTKHDLDSNGNPIPFERKLMAFYLAFRVMSYLSPEGKYHCNGQTFNSIAEMENYKNAQGLK